MAINSPKSPKGITSEINLTQFPKQSSAVGFVSPREEALMKAHLVHQTAGTLLG